MSYFLLEDSREEKASQSYEASDILIPKPDKECPKRERYPKKKKEKKRNLIHLLIGQRKTSRHYTELGQKQ